MMLNRADRKRARYIAEAGVATYVAAYPNADRKAVRELRKHLRGQAADALGALRLGTH